MTLERACEPITVQLTFGGGYNRNSAFPILAEGQREHGRAEVDPLTRELDLGPPSGASVAPTFPR